MSHNPPAFAFTSYDPQPLAQSTADTVDDDNDDFLMLLSTTKMPTTMPTVETTETTEKTRRHNHPAIASTANEPQSLTKSTTDLADNDDNFFLLLSTTTTQTTMPMTGITEMTETTMNHAPPAIAHTAKALQPPTQPTAEINNDAKDDFGPMILTTPPLHTYPTYPTPLPDYHASDSAMINPTTYHSKTTIHWVRDTFAPVFKALNHLTIAIANLSDSVHAATSKLCTADPPMPPTTTPQPHHLQPQLLGPSSHKALPRETLYRTVPHLSNRTQPQTLQQNLYHQQTHHRHRSHTKYREFLIPLLPILHPHSSKRRPPPVHIRFPTYHRYLANNFQPP